MAGLGGLAAFGAGAEEGYQAGVDRQQERDLRTQLVAQQKIATQQAQYDQQNNIASDIGIAALQDAYGVGPPPPNPGMPQQAPAQPSAGNAPITMQNLPPQGAPPAGNATQPYWQGSGGGAATPPGQVNRAAAAVPGGAPPSLQQQYAQDVQASPRPVFRAPLGPANSSAPGIPGGALAGAAAPNSPQVIPPRPPVRPVEQAPQAQPGPQPQQSLVIQPKSGSGLTPIIPGHMTIDDLKKNVMAAYKQKTGEDMPPGAVVSALGKMAKLMSPQELQDYKLLALQQKMAQFDATFTERQLTDSQKFHMQSELLGLRAQIAQMGDSRYRDRTQEMIEALLTKTAASADKTATVTRRQLVSQAGKLGIKVTPEDSDQDVQDKIADTSKEKADAGKFTPEASRTIAEQVVAGDTSSIGRLDKTQKAQVFNDVQKIIAAKSGSGADLAAARVALLGDTAEARRAGTQAATAGVGSYEIEKFEKPLRAAMARVNRTQYPTVNSLIIAAKKGKGDKDVIALLEQIQNMKIAAAQVLVRGGTMSVDANRRADQRIDAAWNNGQLDEAIKQLKIEAAVARSAVGAERHNIQSRISGQPETETPETPEEPASKAPSQGDDPFGILGGGKGDAP